MIELIILFLLYLLPAMIAAGRNHPNGFPIIIVTLFLGWTGLGWVIALAWSLSNIPKTPVN